MRGQARNRDSRATTLRTMSPVADVDDPRTSVSGQGEDGRRRGRGEGDEGEGENGRSGGRRWKSKENKKAQAPQGKRWKKVLRRPDGG